MNVLLAIAIAIAMSTTEK